MSLIMAFISYRGVILANIVAVAMHLSFCDNTAELTPTDIQTILGEVLLLWRLMFSLKVAVLHN